MAILALTPVALVDIHGTSARLDSERHQGIPVEWLYETHRYAVDYLDLGIVYYAGETYFGAIYTGLPPSDQNFLEISG